jgi:hypothetical protein
MVSFFLKLSKSKYFEKLMSDSLETSEKNDTVERKSAKPETSDGDIYVGYSCGCLNILIIPLIALGRYRTISI